MENTKFLTFQALVDFGKRIPRGGCICLEMRTGNVWGFIWKSQSYPKTKIEEMVLRKKDAGHIAISKKFLKLTA